MSLRHTGSDGERWRELLDENVQLRTELARALSSNHAFRREAQKQAARADELTESLKWHQRQPGRPIFDGKAWPTEPVSPEEFRAALYAENARGGEARGVVAEVARALGVDIDSGPGHRWDEDHMRRVVDAARALSDDGPLKATVVRQALRITELEESK